LEKRNILKRINEILIDILGKDDLQVDLNTTAADVEGWDSLKHINIIAAIEDEFSIRFKMEEIVDMKDINSMINIILNRSGY